MKGSSKVLMKPDIGKGRGASAVAWGSRTAFFRQVVVFGGWRVSSSLSLCAAETSFFLPVMFEISMTSLSLRIGCIYDVEPMSPVKPDERGDVCCGDFLGDLAIHDGGGSESDDFVCFLEPVWDCQDILA